MGDCIVDDCGRCTRNCSRRVSCGFFVVVVVPNSKWLFQISFNVNHIDLSAEHAGVLMGLTNTVATLGGIVSPWLSDAIVDGDDKNPKQWAIVFFIAAGIQVCALIGYALAGSGERQF